MNYYWLKACIGPCHTVRSKQLLDSSPFPRRGYIFQSRFKPLHLSLAEETGSRSTVGTVRECVGLSADITGTARSLDAELAGSAVSIRLALWIVAKALIILVETDAALKTDAEPAQAVTISGAGLSIARVKMIVGAGQVVDTYALRAQGVGSITDIATRTAVLRIILKICTERAAGGLSSGALTSGYGDLGLGAGISGSLGGLGDEARRGG